MRTPITTFAFILAVAAVIGAPFYTASQWRHLRHAESALSAARIDQAQARFTVRQNANHRVADAEVPPKDRAIDSGCLEKLETLKTKARKGPGGVPLIFPEELFDCCPSLRDAYVKAKEGELWLIYGPFFANVSMNEDEVQQFCAINMEREIACLEMRKLLPRSNPASEGSPVRQEMNHQAELRQKTQLTALLGSERYRRLEEFEQEIDARRMLLGLNNLVAATYYTDEPITVAQMNQLAALATQWGMFSAAKAATLQDPFGELAVRATTILSPRQLEIFDLMLDFQQLSFAKWQLHSAPSRTN